MSKASSFIARFFSSSADMACLRLSKYLKNSIYIDLNNNIQRKTRLAIQCHDPLEFSPKHASKTRSELARQNTSLDIWMISRMSRILERVSLISLYVSLSS